MTRFISGPRQSGRTRRLIEISSQTGAYIVCPDRRQVESVWRQRLPLGVSMPMPITWWEFREHQYSGRGISGFLIDNLDQCVQGMTAVPITAATIPVAERLEAPAVFRQGTNDLMLPAEIRSVSGSWVLTAHPWAGGRDAALGELRALMATVDTLFLGGQR